MKNIKKTCKIMSTVLCLMLLAGCSKEEAKDSKVDNAEVSTEVAFVEDAKLTDEGIFEVSLKSDDSAAEAYLQVKAVCKDDKGTDAENATKDYNNEVFLRSLNYDEKVEINKDEVEKEIATRKLTQYPDESKYECKYDVQFRYVKSIDEEWDISEWETIFKDVDLKVDFENEKFEEIARQRDFEVERFVEELKYFVERNDAEGFMMHCEFPITINEKLYERFDFDMNNIFTDELMEFIKSIDKKDVSTKDNKYILTGSEGESTSIAFEYVDERFKITELQLENQPEKSVQIEEPTENELELNTQKTD